MTPDELERVYDWAYRSSYSADPIPDRDERRLERHRIALAAVRTALFEALMTEADEQGARVSIPDGRSQRLSAWLRRRRDGA